MKKDIEYYMKLHYTLMVFPDDDGFTAVYFELPGCMTCTPDWNELFTMIEDARRLWIETALEDGDEVPLPAVEMWGN